MVRRHGSRVIRTAFFTHGSKASPVGAGGGWALTVRGANISFCMVSEALGGTQRQHHLGGLEKVVRIYTTSNEKGARPRAAAVQARKPAQRRGAHHPARALLEVRWLLN
jgi:hypothetical protein